MDNFWGGNLGGNLIQVEKFGVFTYMHLFHDVELTLRSVTSSTAVSRRGTNSKVEKIKKKRKYQVIPNTQQNSVGKIHFYTCSERIQKVLWVVVGSSFFSFFMSLSILRKCSRAKMPAEKMQHKMEKWNLL